MPFAEERMQVFFSNWQHADPAGKLTARVMETGGHRSWRDIFKRGKGEYLRQDAIIGEWLQVTEKIENITNELMLSDKNLAELNYRIERSPDHGRPHFRRLEKWEKVTDKYDPQTRHKPIFLYFKPAEKLSKRGHDLVEVYTGQKEGHDAAGALYMFGFLIENTDVLVELVNHELKLSHPITKDDWTAWAWATAFICEHHSKPEKMPPLNELLQKGIVNPMDLLRKTEKMAQIYGYEDIYTLFPPFKTIRNTIDQIRRGEILAYRGFSKEEIESLRTQSFRFSAADKLDGTFPSDLAGARMILTRPGRIFYEPTDKPGYTLQEEFEARVEDGGAHESSCDLNRILFELTRVQALGNYPSYVRHAFRVGMEKRSWFYFNGINKFLEGDFSLFLEAYELLETNEITSLLRKIQINKEGIAAIMNISDHEERHKSIRSVLAQKGFNDNVFDEILFKIHNERSTVQSALQFKLNELRKLRLSKDQTSRIIELLVYAIRIQGDKLPKTVGVSEIDLPYDSYYPIDLT